MVLASQSEVSDREMSATMLIRVQAIRGRSVQLGKQVEGSHSASEGGLQIIPYSMTHLLEVTHPRQHGENAFNNHAYSPPLTLAHFHVGGVCCFRVEAVISKDYHLFLELSNQRVEGAVMDISGCAVPANNQSPLVEHHANLASHYPPAVRIASPPYLVGAATHTHRVDKFQPIAISYSQHGGLCQEAQRPLLVSREQSEQASTFRQSGEEETVIAFYPPN